MKNEKVIEAIDKIITHSQSIEWHEEILLAEGKGKAFCYLDNYFLISKNSEDYFFSILEKTEHFHSAPKGHPLAEIVVERSPRDGQIDKEYFNVIETFRASDYPSPIFKRLYNNFGFKNSNEILDFVIQTVPVIEQASVQSDPFTF